MENSREISSFSFFFSFLFFFFFSQKERRDEEAYKVQGCGDAISIRKEMKKYGIEASEKAKRIINLLYLFFFF